MTELIEPAPTRAMDEREQDLADRIYAAIQSYTNTSERSLQAADYKAGVSDLGYCSERLRRMLNRETPGETDMLKAFIGTALGDHLEQAVAERFDDALIQSEIVCPLVGDRGNVYEVGGHPDIILQRDGILLDGKSAYGLQLARRVGPDQQKQFQRHCYAKGAWLAGFFGDRPLDEVLVGNVWIDRAGKEQGLHVDLEPYDEMVVEMAARWLDDVVYAFLAGEEARKEPAREVCFATCGFAPECRGMETDVTGLLTDDTVLAAVEMYREGLEAEKAGRLLKEEAKPALDGIEGSTGKFTVRWIHVNEVEVPATTRRAHKRLDIRKVK